MLKILSDGTDMGTHIYDEEGNDLSESMDIEVLQVVAGDSWRVYLKCFAQEVNVQAKGAWKEIDPRPKPKNYRMRFVPVPSGKGNRLGCDIVFMKAYTADDAVTQFRVKYPQKTVVEVAPTNAEIES